MHLADSGGRLCHQIFDRGEARSYLFAVAASSSEIVKPSARRMCSAPSTTIQRFILSVGVIVACESDGMLPAYFVPALAGSSPISFVTSMVGRAPYSIHCG
jgi:hypothetical protein